MADLSVVRHEVGAGVGRITLNRPERLNAFTVELARELHLSLLELGARSDVNVILVRGAGGNFSAGGDFHEVERLRAEGRAGLAPLFENFARACGAVAQIEQPVVVAIEGVAMAGGFEFLQAADIGLVSENARIADNHINFAQVPGGGGSQRLPRLVGRHRALGHLLSGDRLTGPDLVAWGLAYRCFPVESFDESVETFVQALAGRNRAALTGIKRLVRSGLEGSLDAGLTLEFDTVLGHIAGDAGQDGVASFASKGA